MAILGTISVADIKIPSQAFLSTVPLLVSGGDAASTLRDTSVHDTTTNATIAVADCRFLGGNKTLYVVNGLNQSVTVQLMISIDGVANPILVGSAQTVTATTTTWIDDTAYAQLNKPYPFVSIQIKASVSPTTGTLAVSLVVKSA